MKLDCHDVCRRAGACWNKKCTWSMILKGRENWLPEATIFASSYKPSLKIWNPTVMKYVEEQRLVGIKNAHALRLWNLDIATWCMNSFYIALSNWQTLHKWNVMKYDESKKISQASKAAITLRICTMMVTYIFEVSPFPHKLWPRTWF